MYFCDLPYHLDIYSVFIEVLYYFQFYGSVGLSRLLMAFIQPIATKPLMELVSSASGILENNLILKLIMSMVCFYFKPRSLNIFIYRL